MKNIIFILVIMFCLYGCKSTPDAPAKFNVGDVVKFKAFPGSRCYITSNGVFQWSSEPSENTWNYFLKCSTSMNGQYTGIEHTKAYEWEIEAIH